MHLTELCYMLLYTTPPSTARAELCLYNYKDTNAHVHNYKNTITQIQMHMCTNTQIQTHHLPVLPELSCVLAKILHCSWLQMLQSIIGWCNWTDARFSQLMSLHNCFCPICCSFADPIFQTSCKLKMEETSFNTNRRKVTDWDERATWWTRPTTTSSPCPTRSPTSSTLTSRPMARVKWLVGRLSGAISRKKIIGHILKICWK